MPRNNFRLNTLLITLALAASTYAAPTTAPADNTPYDIKFDRPQKVGQFFDIAQSIDVSQDTLAKAKGQDAKKESMAVKYTMEGTLEVLAVDEIGRCAKFNLTIKKIQATESDAPLADVLKHDLIIEATYGDNKIDCKIVKADEPISELAGRAIGSFPIFAPRAAKPKFTNDELVGSKDKKKAGDSWPINLKIAGESMGLNPDKSSGTVKFDAVKSENGHQWIQLTETLDSTEITDPNLGKAVEAKLSITALEFLPVDTTDPSEKSQSNRKAHAVFKGNQQDGTPITLTLDRTEKRSNTMHLSTKPPAATAPATQPAK